MRPTSCLPVVSRATARLWIAGAEEGKDVMPIEMTLTLAAVGAIVVTLIALERTADARRKIRVRSEERRDR